MRLSSLKSAISIRDRWSDGNRKHLVDVAFIGASFNLTGGLRTYGFAAGSSVSFSFLTAATGATVFLCV